MRKLFSILCACALWVHSPPIWAQSGPGSGPTRSRAEAVPGMHASNTAGLGDIWVQAAMSGAFRVKPVPQEQLLRQVDSMYARDAIALYGGGERMGRDLLLNPSIKATVGIAEFLQLDVENVPWDGEKIGASRAGLTLTTPGNDDLRMLGFAVRADATLSTEEDIYSRGETTPGFDPLFHLGAVADIDLIKRWPSLPIKAFVNWSSLADYRLAHAFEQQWVGGAIAWKGYRREYYGRLGLSWFKPKPTRFDPNPSQAWQGPHADVGMGIRWFFAARIWGNAEISFDPIAPTAFYSDATYRPPRLFVGFDMPILFQETRAEAVRALIYTEEMRRVARRKATQSQKHSATKAGQVDSSAMNGAAVQSGGIGDAAGLFRPGQTGLGQVSLDQLELKSRGNDSAGAALKSLFEDQDEVAAEKRKRVRQELKHIEELLP
jgi:hypothetical protein